ncbi:ABC transporter permease [Ilumatobacter nonamiensis]|uniref:ABC transporter permease n=1 Tax=Ilumatobacter nonamiensis TaxID=467093 RepID=UPI000346E033|nr:ABC transporter permease [Ilumatobacter nonamiensis]
MRDLRNRPGLLTGRLSTKDSSLTFALYALSLLGALVISGALVAATGGSAPDVLSALLDGSVRSPGAWGLTLTTAAPLLLVAIGTIVATRAGLVNIGQEGQVLIGAAFAAYAAVRLGGPGWVVVTGALLFGAVGGGAWAGIAAGLRAWRNVPEVLTTLLLTFIAFPLVTFGLSQAALIADRDTTRQNQLNTGEIIPGTALLPDVHLFGNAIDSGFLVAIGLSAVLAYLISRTLLGTRVDMLGYNPRAAQRFGVAAGPLSAAVLIGSGATAGVAGAVLLTGGAAGDRLVFGFSGNFGWDGLLVALLARNRILVALPVALIFAMLRTGSSFLAATGVDRKVTEVVQALLVLALLIPPAVLFIRDRRRALRSSNQKTPATAPEAT